MAYNAMPWYDMAWYVSKDVMHDVCGMCGVCCVVCAGFVCYVTYAMSCHARPCHVMLRDVMLYMLAKDAMYVI